MVPIILITNLIFPFAFLDQGNVPTWSPHLVQWEVLCMHYQNLQSAWYNVGMVPITLHGGWSSAIGVVMGVPVTSLLHTCTHVHSSIGSSGAGTVIAGIQGIPIFTVSCTA